MSDETTSLRSLQRRLFMNDSAIKLSEKKKNPSKDNSLKLPPLPRDYFVHLWKSLHDLIEFGNLDDTTLEGRQAMYHSVSVVGTLLLQIGEVGQRVKDAQQLMRSRYVHCL